MIGEKLKEIRKQLSWSQTEMAVLLSVNARSYASYERDENNPPNSLLIKLCNDYNVNLNWLLADKGGMFNQQQPFVSNDELEQKVVEVMKKYGVIEK